MSYLITLPSEYDKALAAMVVDSPPSTAEDLIQSAAMSMLQGRVAQTAEQAKAALIDAFEKADPAATKDGILASVSKGGKDDPKDPGAAVKLRTRPKAGRQTAQRARLPTK